MGRMFWTGVGAAGGIYAYRRGTRVVEGVKVRGAWGTAQVVATAALALLTQVRVGPDGMPQGLQRSPRAKAQPVLLAAGEHDGVVPVTTVGMAEPGLRVGRFRISRADQH